MTEVKKVLIVDDEPDIVKTLEFRIRKAGYQAIVAVNGKEGLDKASEEKPDLILLDYRLPIMNGIEVFRKLQDDEKLKDIPVVFLTASSGSEEVKKLLEGAGAKHILIKPYEPEELLTKVQELI